MRRDPIEETDPTVEMEEFLSRICAPPTKKKARKFSKISTDEDGSRTLHVAIHIECDRDEVVPENYVITTMELGRPTGAQIIEECDNSYQALNDRLLRFEGKYKRLKREHRALIGYVQHLAHPCERGNPAVDLSAELPRESISGLEELKKAIQEADKWVGGVRVEAEKFIEDLLSSFQHASSILTRMENVDQAWTETHTYQDKTIPRLAALMHMPM